MQIAIIGASTVGRALAGSTTRAGHTVTVSAARPEHAQSVAQQTGAQAAGSNRAAVAPAELVILAVPSPAVDRVLADLGDALAGKVLVDATNRVDPADPASVLDGTSAAEHIQARAPAARVVKAFNTAFAARQANPPVDGTPVDGFVAGDDAAAKSSVLELVGSLGFRPVDAGPLVMARVLEGMALLNIAHQLRTRGAWQAGWKLLEPAAPPAGH
jgi:predicted dinucleotide-binding enzyme